MSDTPSMTVAKLMAHLRRFRRDAEIVDLEVSVLVDAESNLVQTLSLWDDDDEGEDPDDPEREDLPVEADRKVVNLPPRRTKPQA